MKLLTREFTRNEKILLLVLAVVILALCYYNFIYIPIKNQIADAESEAENLQIEQTIADAKLEEMRDMQDELDGIEADGTGSYMASYNNKDAEVEFLSEVLIDAAGTDITYDITIGDAVCQGNQVRRNISLQFTVYDYAQAEQILRGLEECEYRCLVSDVSVTCSGGDVTAAGEAITVSATATFYETMVGGTSDAALLQETVDETAEETDDSDLTER